MHSQEPLDTVLHCFGRMSLIVESISASCLKTIARLTTCHLLVSLAAIDKKKSFADSEPDWLCRLGPSLVELPASSQ